MTTLQAELTKEQEQALIAEAEAKGGESSFEDFLTFSKNYIANLGK